MVPFNCLPLLQHLLARLVRIAIGCGLPYQTFAKLVRQVYFEVAIGYEPVKGKANSDSRVSLLTGLARRDVRALRESPPEPLTAAPSLDRLVMDAWTSNLDLLDAHGKPLPLPRTLRQGGQRSFESLVQSVAKDIRARSLLDEWLRRGNVVLDAEDRVVLVAQRPSTGPEGADAAGLLVGEMAADLLAGFESSYVRSKAWPGYGFQVVYGHGLSEESAQFICSTAYREAGQLSHRINRLIVERETLDAQRRDAKARVCIGLVICPADGVSDPGLLTPAAARTA